MQAQLDAACAAAASGPMRLCPAFHNYQRYQRNCVLGHKREFDIRYLVGATAE
jgi:hypothetical protein